MKIEHIQETFGNIDIYLFDQLLKSTYDGAKLFWMLYVEQEETCFTF